MPCSRCICNHHLLPLLPTDNNSALVFVCCLYESPSHTEPTVPLRWLRAEQSVFAYSCDCQHHSLPIPELWES